MSDYTYLIIGGGMAAAAAMKGIRQVDANGAIGIVTAETNPPYDRPPLTKGLWKGDTQVDAILRNTGDAAIVPGRRVTQLDLGNKRATDQRGDTYGYEKLLLATGGTPRRLPFGDDRILYYRTLDDYRQLRELTQQYERFAVIGGSFIGSELAAALAMNDKQVTLLFPEVGICARLFPKDVALYLNGYYRGKGVDVMANEHVNGLDGAFGGFSLRTQSGKTIEADVVVAGIGIQPNVALAEAAGLQVDNGIIVDESLQTSQPDVYAAGDVANYPDQVLGTRRRVEHEDNANSMGETAGRAMAGAAVTYDYSPMFYSDLFDIGYEAVGELDAQMDTVADWQEKYEKGVIYYLDDNRVRGVLLWNVWEKVDDARQLIAAGETVQPADLQGRIE